MHFSRSCFVLKEHPKQQVSSKNDSSSQSIKDCDCSVDSVEELTNFDFFHYMEDEIENTIESKSELKKLQYEKRIKLHVECLFTYYILMSKEWKYVKNG